MKNTDTSWSAEHGLSHSLLIAALSSPGTPNSTYLIVVPPRVAPLLHHALSSPPKIPPAVTRDLSRDPCRTMFSGVLQTIANLLPPMGNDSVHSRIGSVLPYRAHGAMLCTAARVLQQCREACP